MLPALTGRDTAAGHNRALKHRAALGGPGGTRYWEWSALNPCFSKRDQAGPGAEPGTGLSSSSGSMTLSSRHHEPPEERGRRSKESFIAKLPGVRMRNQCLRR